MKLLNIVCALCSLLYLEVTLAADDLGCAFWNQLAYNLSHASEQNSGAVRLACNSGCTNITCSGHFKAPTLVSRGFEFDFCFGLSLNHCDGPVSMDFYLIVPSLSVNKSGSFSHNSSLDIPGPNIMGGQSTIVILVEMVPVNKSYILFGVNANLRVMFGNVQTFPLKERVFPPTYIDIPPCSAKPKTRVPFTSPAVCVPQPSTVKPLLTTTAPKTAGPTQKPVIHTKTFNQSCELGLSQCGKFEMCRVISDNDKRKSGICVCDPDSVFDPKSGFCVQQSTPKPATTKATKSPSVTTDSKQKSKQPGGSTATTKATKSPSVTTNSKQKSKQPGGSTVTTKPTGSPSVTMANKQKSEHTGVNMTAVIIGAVFGGLLLIVVVVSVIIFIGRRRRQADYRGHHQLLSDHDDDDDTNVVI